MSSGCLMTVSKNWNWMLEHLPHLPFWKRLVEHYITSCKDIGKQKRNGNTNRCARAIQTLEIFYFNPCSCANQWNHIVYGRFTSMCLSFIRPVYKSRQLRSKISMRFTWFFCFFFFLSYAVYNRFAQVANKIDTVKYNS